MTLLARILARYGQFSNKYLHTCVQIKSYWTALMMKRNNKPHQNQTKLTWIVFSFMEDVNV
jgi:hypothetical protein